MASDIENAWAAGLIDGDGCITKVWKDIDHTYWVPVVVVDSTDLEILEELSRIYGGGKLVRKKVYNEDKHRQAWSWRMYGADKIIQFLSEIMPYMRCEAKKDRASILVDRYKDVTPRNGYYTDELREAKRVLGEEFSSIGSGRGSRGVKG